MAAKKKSASRATTTEDRDTESAAVEVAPPELAPTYRPRLGEIVELEITEGHRVRNAQSAAPLSTGDRVNWSTYYERRRRDGALRPIQFVPPNDTAGDPVGAREETDQ